MRLPRPAATAARVEKNTSPRAQRAIDERTRLDVARHRAAGRAALDHAADRLDREWDVERVLQLNYALVVLLGLGLGRAVSRRWYLLPAVASGFLALHALQGWCPPLPVLRRLGVRTAREISRERYAVDVLRGR